MEKKLLLLALVGTTALTLLTVAGLALSNESSFSIAADGAVEHNLVMTTENTTVSTDGDYFYDLYMDTYTTHGNKFSASDDSRIVTESTVHCNTEDALFEVSEDNTIEFELYICFDFHLDVEIVEGENFTACMYYKLKSYGGWDEEPTKWDVGSGLYVEGNHASVTFDNSFYSSCGFKLISCNFTYSCSY